MNKMIKTGSLFGVAFLCAIAGAADPAPAGKIDNEFVNRSIDLGRQEIKSRAEKHIARANTLLTEFKYMEAVKEYSAAKKEFSGCDAVLFRQRINFCDEQIAKCYFQRATAAMERAERLALASEFDAAIGLCREAIKYCPEQTDVLEQTIAKYERYREQALENANVSEERLLPERKNQEYQIQVLMEHGRKLFKEGELIKARRKFEEVLLINPYNADAITSLQAVNRKIGKIGIDRRHNQHRSYMGEIEWKYSVPIMPEGESSAAKNIIAGGDAKIKQRTESLLQKKMAGMIIPRLSFNEVTLADATRTLRNMSSKLDPSNRPINIILHSSRNIVKSSVSQPKPTEEQAENPDGDGAGTGEEKVNTDTTANDGAANPDGDQTGDNQQVKNNLPIEEELVNLEIKEKSMLDAIRDLCKINNLVYRIDDYAVVISRPQDMINEMQTKLFAIELSNGSEESIRADLKSNGVSFPNGSSIFYDERIRRLVATNTIANLKKIEEVIHELYDNSDPMIQLQLKFMEVTQNDLDELAFSWQVGVNTNAERVHDDGNLNSAYITGNANSNELMRYYRGGDMQKGGDNDPLGDANLNYIWANSDGTNVRASMYALNYADATDALSSPRITTRSGVEATVKMTETHYYPDDWENIDVETSDGIINGWRMTGADPFPNLDNEQELGVSFTVRPVLEDKERRLIRVPISFPVKSFSGWMVFDARTVDSGGDVDGEYYQMPILDERSLSTNILIYDGETVVLGGIGRDNSTTVNDKIPILGDIPFIGRFFRSKYVDSQKTNLLVFLTCRLVKPDGTAFYPDEVVDHGSPTFGRIN